MQDEYDFSNAERGKFYRSETALQLPIYLDPDVREYLAVRAKAKVHGQADKKVSESG